MSRVQLALNVSDLDRSVAFYQAVFGVAPHKRRPGYANFEVADPPLKLVLIETTAEQRGEGVESALNHLGVEVGSREEVDAAQRRFVEAGLSTALEEATECCYAEQDKVWVADPAGAPWEFYVITDDDPEQGRPPKTGLDVVGAPACCSQLQASATCCS